MLAPADIAKWTTALNQYKAAPPAGPRLYPGQATPAPSNALNPNDPAVAARLAALNPSGVSSLAPTGAPADSIAQLPAFNPNDPAALAKIMKNPLGATPPVGEGGKQMARMRSGGFLTYNPTTGDVVQTNPDGSRYRSASGVKDFNAYLGRVGVSNSAGGKKGFVPQAMPYDPTKIPAPAAGPSGDPASKIDAPANTKAAPPVVVPPGTDPKTSADAGVFDGAGLFTSWDASAAMQGAGKAQWVAIDPRHATIEQVNALRAKGMKIMVWQDMASPDAAALVKKFGADGYIAQAESQDQLDAAQKYGGNVGVPRALVSNNFMDKYPPGWVAMPEAYANDNAPSTVGNMVNDARNRGAVSIVPITGNYPGSNKAGRPTTMAEYRDQINAAGVSGSGAYLAEEMSPADWSNFNGFLYGVGAPTPGVL